jgi:hypothetical protein
MLIEMKDSQLTIDSNPKLKDFRMNFESLSRWRVKASLVRKEKEFPIDIVMIHLRLPSFTNHSIKMVGKEMITDNIFDLEIKFHIIKMMYEINGKVGDKNISFFGKTKKDIINEITKIIIK